MIMSFRNLEEQLQLALNQDENTCPCDIIRSYRDLFKKSKNVTQEEVPVFAERFPTLFKMVSEGTDLQMLDIFLSRLEAVQRGDKQLKETEEDLAHLLNEKYVVPKLKEAK